MPKSLMRSIPALLLLHGMVLLLNGCASLDKQHEYTVPESRLQEIRQLVANRSVRLETLFMERADQGRHFDVQQSEVNIDNHRELSPQSILHNFLLTTHSDQLLPDEAFEQAHDIAGNKDVDIHRDYAHALSKYIVDDRYKCKRPLFFQYFKDRYGNDRKEASCPSKVPFKISSNLQAAEVLWLNPERVSEVHVLFAGEGDGVISKFGHISLRLIICPKDDYGEAACNSNIYEHMVLGYRAHIDEFKIDPFAGLLGGYRAYLFASRFMDVYQEYAIGEFREMYSLPLKLNHDDSMKLVSALSEIHWGYTGEYKFLSNNCSSLAQKSLMHIWDEFSRDPDLNELYWRPDTFFSKLRGSTLTDDSKLDDLTIAEQEGYYFSSTRPIYEEALTLVRESMAAPEFRDIDEYMLINPVQRMKQALNDKSFFEAISNNHRLLNAKILLEELSVTKYEQRLLAEMSYYFDQNDIRHIRRHMKEQLNDSEYHAFSNCILDPLQEYAQPVKRADGIPNSASASTVIKEGKTCESDDTRSYLKRVGEEMNKIDPESWRPIEVAIHYWATSLKNVGTLTAMETNQSSNTHLQ